MEEKLRKWWLVTDSNGGKREQTELGRKPSGEFKEPFWGMNESHDWRRYIRVSRAWNGVEKTLRNEDILSFFNPAKS